MSANDRDKPVVLIADNEPDIVELVNWWPDGPRLKALNVAQRIMAGGIARKS